MKTTQTWNEMKAAYDKLPTFEHSGYTFHDHIDICSCDCGNCPKGPSSIDRTIKGIVTLVFWDTEKAWYSGYGPNYTREEAADRILRMAGLSHGNR